MRRHLGRGLVGLVAACVLATGFALSAPSGAGALVESGVRVVTSGDDSELVRTVPISKRRRQKQRVVMSIGPEKLGSLAAGGRLDATAEVEVSVTCLEPMPKCIGRIYHFTPSVNARFVLAPGPRAAAGRSVVPVGGWDRGRCSQKLPNRNHHCVIVPKDASIGLPEPRNLPCAPASCHLNLVLDAHNRKAKRGHKLVVGVDSDSGVEQDKGRLNAAVHTPGVLKLLDTGATRLVTSERLRRKLPVAPRGSSGGKHVLYSLRLDDLREGEQLLVEARMRADIRRLRYNALIHSQLILAEHPQATTMKGVPRKAAGTGAQITEKNGFNCTRGKSAHRSPCLVRKQGILRVTGDAKQSRKSSRTVPLYVNLVVGSAAVFGGKHRSGDAAKIRKGGYIEARRYPARLGL